MFKPHHSCVCKDVYTQNHKMILVPELWINADNLTELAKIESYKLAVATDGSPIQEGSELVIKDFSFFEFLKKRELLSYTLFSDERYLKDLPVFFQEEWSQEIKLEAMNLLGWTVNKFTEPALLYGDFPIRPILSNGIIISYEVLDNSVVNDWGLIDTYENASQIADKNTVEDLYKEIWRPLAVCVDDFTFNKIRSLKL